MLHYQINFILRLAYHNKVMFYKPTVPTKSLFILVIFFHSLGSLPVLFCGFYLMQLIPLCTSCPLDPFLFDYIICVSLTYPEPPPCVTLGFFPVAFIYLFKSLNLFEVQTSFQVVPALSIALRCLHLDLLVPNFIVLYWRVAIIALQEERFADLIYETITQK